MEPIPLAHGQLLLTHPDDHTLLARDPDLIAGALAANPHDLMQMRMTCPETPVGLMLPCPPVPQFEAPPMTAPYISVCRKAFRPLIEAEAAYYYLAGAADFRALRAAVLAVTDLTGANLIAELQVDANARMTDGTSVLAAVAVLQRIGVSTIILNADHPEDLEDALQEAAPYARVSLGVRCPAVWLLHDVQLPNVELFLPAPGERARRLADLVCQYAAKAPHIALARDLDDVVLAPDGRDAHFIDWSVLAAVAVLQRIGVSTIILNADHPEDLEDALQEAAPYARVSLGVRCPAVWLLHDVQLPNVELFLPAPGERARRLADLVCQYAAKAPHIALARDLDDVVLAPDGRDAHFIDWTTDISDEVACDHLLVQRLLELEDEESAAFKLLLEEDEDVLLLEENLYMITRPVCICADSPELLEKALRVYAGLSLYDGTWEQEPRILKYFTEKYGLICM